jgi:tetratricopeptide (TPR) repeat protein
MEKKLEASSEIFQRVLKISPNDLTARRYLAANLWQLQRFVDAKKHLAIILKAKPEDAEARLLMGMVAENMKDYATAARMLASVPQQVRQRPESLAALARSYYHLGQKENARTTLTQLSGPQAVFLGAQIADERQDYGTAEKLLGSIKSTFPDQDRLAYTLALVHYHAHRLQDSQRILQELIESGHKTAPVLNLLGWCYQKQNQPREAVKALEESIALAPNEPVNYFDLGKILLAQRSLPSALDVAKRATAAFPESAAALEFRGSVEGRMGQFTDAIRSYSQAAEIDSTSADGILGLAEAQSSAGMLKDARSNFEAGIRRFPKDARFKLQYAVMLLRQAETGDAPAETRAEQLLRSALAQDQSLPDARYQLGNLALKKGRLAEAQQQLELAAKLDPDSAATHFALSRVYRRLGRKAGAARQMELYEKFKTAEDSPPSHADPNP